VAKPKNTEYQLELVLQESLGIEEGEVVLKGIVGNPTLALNAYYVLEGLMGGSLLSGEKYHTINVYKNDEVITIDELFENHLVYFRSGSKKL
jgi:hypothetical protein